MPHIDPWPSTRCPSCAELYTQMCTSLHSCAQVCTVVCISTAHPASGRRPVAQIGQSCAHSCAQVCKAVHKCAQLCTSVHSCAQVHTVVHESAQLCAYPPAAPSIRGRRPIVLGVHSCAHSCAQVCKAVHKSAQLCTSLHMCVHIRSPRDPLQPTRCAHSCACPLRFGIGAADSVP